MTACRAFVRRLFAPPGQGPGSSAGPLLDGAAACHRRLLLGAAARIPDGPGEVLDALLGTLADAACPRRARALLNHPLLVDALHALAPEDPDLRAWDEATCPPDPDGPAFAPAAHGRARLNNVAWPLLLRRAPGWCGRVELGADALGFVRFPTSDWSVWLRTTSPESAGLLAHAVVAVAADPERVSWSLAEEPSNPFLVLGRRDCGRLVVAGDPGLSPDRLEFPHPTIRPRLLHATPLDDSGLRYEPAGFDDAGLAAHAGLTGALVQAILGAIGRNAPAIHAETGLYLRAIRGFELPSGPGGSVASFSTPNLPGILNLNVAYSPDDQPLLSPFCFTWIGHELGHTKHYLIDDAALEVGWRFVRNPGDRTGPLPRYGRSLAVRTLFQIPYVHLYELALLAAFLERGFAGLPWDVADDPLAFGDDLAAEIREAFALIDAWADLTPPGEAAVAHLQVLSEPALARWASLRDRTGIPVGGSPGSDPDTYALAPVDP
jgi:hypothetical protein